jgi:hypothetical protein
MLGFHYWLLISNEDTLDTAAFTTSRRKAVVIAREVLWRAFADGPSFYNPHLLPHGGNKWGNKFTVHQFRLDKRSRRRRFLKRQRASL